MSNKLAITKIQTALIAGIIIVAFVAAGYYLMTQPSEPEKETRTLVFSQDFPVGRPDPHQIQGDQDYQWAVNVYDPLIHPLPGGEVGPYVATSWETSADGLTYTLQIKEGIKFHDDSELTAEDVVFSMNRQLTIKLGLAHLFPEIEKSEVLDTYKVQFKLKKRFAPFLATLTRLYIVNKELVMEHCKEEGAYGEFGDYATEWLMKNDAGSGAYKFKEIDLTDHVIMEKFEDYWNDFVEDAPDEVIYRGPNEPTALKVAMDAGSVHVSDAWQGAETLEILDSVPGVDILSIPLGQEWYFMMHTKKPPLDDIHFRKAMAWAFDYDAFVDLVPGSIQSKGPVPQDIAGHNPNVFQYHRDLDKAMEELEKSKYYDKLDEYPVEFAYFASLEDEEKMAILLTNNMAEIGINVEGVATQGLKIHSDMNDINSSAHIYPMFIGVDYPDAGSIIEMKYHSKSVGTIYQNEWLQNSTIDSLIEEAQMTVDETARKEKLYELQEIIVEMCPTIFVCDAQNRRAKTNWVISPYEGGEGSIPGFGSNFEFRLWSVKTP